MAVPSKTLHIDIADYKTEIEKWTILLERTNSWETPRRVTVAPSTKPPGETEHDMIILGDSMLEDSDGQGFQQEFKANVLIELIRKLPSLCNLEWQTNTLLMPPLLQFLRDELPSCSLHLKPLHIGYDAKPLYVRSVLSLPSLWTIWFDRRFDGAVEKIVQHMARASNGNVQEIRIYCGSTGAAPWGQPLPDMWEEELAAPDGPRGRVQSLQLTGTERADRDHLDTWARHMEFSHLSTLSLEICVTRAGLETLTSLPLQSLHSLELVLDWSDKSDEYNTALQTFICNLPCLSHFRLTGDLPPPTLQAILSHLDPTLHTLCLDPETAFDPHTITLLTDRCTHVRTLGLPIRRAWNKPGFDTAILQSLGRLPHLTTLDLTLDASDRTLLSAPETKLAPSSPSFSPFDNQQYSKDFSSGKAVRNGHIRDAIINSAVDARLATTAFATILSGAPEGHTAPLRCLSIKVEGGGHLGISSINGGASGVADEVGKEWVVERAAGQGGELKARCVGELNEYLEPGDLLGWDVSPVFRSVWPGEGDWFEEWCAFPLS